MAQSPHPPLHTHTIVLSALVVGPAPTLNHIVKLPCSKVHRQTKTLLSGMTDQGLRDCLLEIKGKAKPLFGQGYRLFTAQGKT